MSQLRYRQRWVVTIALGAAVVSTAAMVASLFIKSPQQLAAETSPPPLTVLTAQVENRVLVDTVVLRGKVQAQYRVSATPGSAQGRAVITAQRVAAGDTVTPGQVLVEVSGRPLIYLPGTVPAYRDLRPGADGKDIQQLQAALRSLGYGDTDRAGFYGESTKSAVTEFYKDRGYAAATTGDEDARALEALDRQVRQGERAVQDAKAALAQAQKDEAADPTLDNQRRVADARTALQRAQEDLALDKADLAKLRREAGTMVPLGEIMFVPASPARVEALSGTVGGDVPSPLITIGSGPPSITAHLGPTQRELIAPGMGVEITADLLGVSARGTVTRIGDLAQDEVLGRGYPVVVTPDSALDKRLLGEDVRIAVERARTKTEVLVVPLAAITAAADGSAIVVKRAEDGTETRITVSPGVSGDGFVAVTVAGEGRLDPGDRVVVSGDR